jgi:hypothetical protein
MRVVFNGEKEVEFVRKLLVKHEQKAERLCNVVLNAARDLPDDVASTLLDTAHDHLEHVRQMARRCDTDQALYAAAAE